MHCLFNYIGIKDCSPRPSSGRYVNELPGMSSEMMKSYVNGDDVTTQQLFEDIQRNAFDKLVEDIPEIIASKYKLKSIIDCSISENKPSEDPLDPNQFYPVKVISEINSQFLSIGFDCIQVFALTDGNFTYKLNGVEKTVEVKEGWNAVSLENHTTVEKGFLLEINGNLVKGYQKCDGGIVVSSEAAVNLNLSVTCDYSAIICRNKKAFLRAWQFLLGFSIVTSGKCSSNINMFTTILKGETVDLEKLYLDNYETSLSKTLKGLVVDTNDFCVDCNNRIVRKTLLP